MFTADDFTLRAGHADGALMAKTLYMEKLCVSLKLPMIKVIDGASGGGSITNYKTMQGSYLPDLALLQWLVCNEAYYRLGDLSMTFFRRKSSTWAFLNAQRWLAL